MASKCQAPKGVANSHAAALQDEISDACIDAGQRIRSRASIGFKRDIGFTDREFASHHSFLRAKHQQQTQRRAPALVEGDSSTTQYGLQLRNVRPGTGPRSAPDCPKINIDIHPASVRRATWLGLESHSTIRPAFPDPYSRYTTRKIDSLHCWQLLDSSSWEPLYL